MILSKLLFRHKNSGFSPPSSKFIVLRLYSAKKSGNKWTLPNLTKLNETKENTVTKQKRTTKSGLDESDRELLVSLNSGPRMHAGWRKMKTLPEWKRQKFALVEKLQGSKWNPRKKLSRDTIEGIRLLKGKLPQLKADYFAEQFQVSPEAVRRILKSRWEPTVKEREGIEERWKRRGVKHLQLKIKEQLLKKVKEKGEKSEDDRKTIEGELEDDVIVNK
ncbi:BA75_01891T0 [Komagataella pastoris]|uniref:Required for respiratory growth protein 9, mitochondrial n=1 Tax=Komagataella pastoris TaxID=4922 RepID=A0A1B2JD10_PICPA|nr:BA75_01891T0 [Komagataella pastoris]